MSEKLEYTITPSDLNMAHKSGTFTGLSKLAIGDTLLYDTAQNKDFLLQVLIDHLQLLYEYDIYLKGDNHDWFAIRIISHK